MVNAMFELLIKIGVPGPNIKVERFVGYQKIIYYYKPKTLNTAVYSVLIGGNMLRLGVLASTKATDLQAVIDAISSKKLNAVISVVVSNKKDAYALERARKHNIKPVFIDSKGKNKEEFDKK